MKKRTKIIGGIVGVIVALGIVGAVTGGSSSDTSSTASTSGQPTHQVAKKAAPVVAAPSSPDQELKAMLKTAGKPKVTTDDTGMTLTYTLNNNTKDSFDYVELDVDFYNKAGVKIDSEMTNTQNVTPGQKFQLQVNCLDTTATSYKVIGIYSSSLHN